MSEKKAVVTKKLVLDFLTESGYEWDGKVIDIKGNGVSAKNSDFQGHERIVRLNHNGKLDIYKLEINLKNFIIYGIDIDSDACNMEDVIYIYDDLTINWLKNLIRKFPDDTSFYNMLRVSLARRINRTAAQCSEECNVLYKQIEEIKNKAHADIMVFKEILNEMDNYIKSDNNKR